MNITIKTLDEARASRVEMTFKSDPTGEHVIAFSRQNAEVDLDLSDTAANPKITDLERMLSDAVTRAEKAEKAVREYREAARIQSDHLVRVRQDLANEKSVMAMRGDRILELELMLSNNQGRTERAEKLAAEMKERAEKAENLAASYRRDLHGSGGIWDELIKAKNLAVEMKERAEQAEKRENDKGANDRQRIKLARQALRRYFPESLITDDVAPLITDLITKIKELRGEVGGYQESSERCERELHNARVSLESRDRLLSAATTALRKIAMEVQCRVVGPVNVMDNVRDLASPWADTSSEDKAGRPLYQA